MKWPGRQEGDTKRSNGRGDLLRRLIKANLKRTFFTNEKLFKLQTALITQTNRVYAKRGKKKQTSNGRLYVERQAFAKLWFLLVYPYTVRQLYMLLSRKTWVLKKFIPQMCKLCPSFIFWTGWCEMAYVSIYTALHPVTCLETPGNRILAISKSRSQLFPLLPLGSCWGCDAQSSERRRLLPVEERNRQSIEGHSSGNYLTLNSYFLKTFWNVY